MKEIADNLYQFTNYISKIDFAIHQYLYNGETPFLMGTGTAEFSKQMILDVKEVLKEKKLKYILVSHMEPDECGGLPHFLREYPEAKVICSEDCARELPAYGVKGEVVAVKGRMVVADKEMELECIDYPAEVHHQNGIVFFERNSDIFFSSDLMERFGDGRGKLLKAEWKKEVEEVKEQRGCNPGQLESLKKELRKISPKLVAVGHGFCLDVL